MSRFTQRAVVTRRRAPHRWLGPIPVTVAAALLAITACTGGGGGTSAVAVSHSSALEDASANLKANLEGLEGAFDFIETSELLADFANLLGDFDDGDDLDDFGGDEGPDGWDSGEPQGPREPRPGQEEENDAIEVDLGDLIDDALAEIRENILVADRVEAQPDPLTVIYRVDPEWACGIGESDDVQGHADAPPGGPREERLDDGEDGDRAECLETLEAVPLRIRATSPRDGDVMLTVLVGEPRHAVLQLELYAGHLAGQVDLGALKSAVELVMEATGEDADEEALELPEVIQGVVRADLIRNSAAGAPADFTVSVSIVEAVVVEAQDPEPITLRLDTASPLASLRLDAAAATATAEIAVAQIDASLPFQWWLDMTEGGEGVACAAPPRSPDGEEQMPEDWDCDPGPQADPPPASGTLRVTLAGLTASTVFTGESDELRFDGVGLGQGTTSVRWEEEGQTETLIAVDLNTDHGRAFNVVIRLAPDTGNPQISVEPAFDLAVQLALHHVAEHFEDLPTFALDETIRFALDNAEAPTLELVGGDDHGDENQDSDDDAGRALQVVSGRLLMSSTRMDQDVVIEAGQCVLDRPEEEVPEDAHELFGDLLGGACPQAD